MARIPSPGASLADRLCDLARRVAALRIDRRDPEAFYLERSALAGELRDLAATPAAAGPADPAGRRPR